MDDSAVKPVAPKKNQVHGNFLNLNPGGITRMKLQVSLLHTHRVRGNLRLPVFQKVQGIPKLKEGNDPQFLHILGKRV